MATGDQSLSQSPSESTSVTKKVLVRLGERSREVSFLSKNNEIDSDKLVQAAIKVYHDVLSDEDKEHFILQLKNEEWSGDFLDIAGVASIPDKSVLKAIVVQPLKSLKDNSKGITSRAITTLDKIKKPSGASVKELSTLFPSSKQLPVVNPGMFDPLKDCIALSAQKKKKATKVRPSTVQVILLSKESLRILPKGKKRSKLDQEHRIQYVELTRNMTFEQVKAKICSAFVQLNLCIWQFLQVVDGHLIISPNQNPGGELVDRRGALYIQESAGEGQRGNYDAGGNTGTTSSKDTTVSIAASDSSSDEELPSVYFAHKRPRPQNIESIEETRQIRAMQEQEYHESLRIDQAKDIERRRLQTLMSIKSVLKEKYESTNQLSGTSTTDMKKITIHLPSGDRITRFFSVHDSCKEVYMFAFSQSKIVGPFEILSNYPRKVVCLEEKVSDIECVLRVEEGKGLEPTSFIQVQGNDQDQSVVTQSCILNLADEQRQSYLMMFDVKRGITHQINRKNIFHDVIDLYKEKQEELLLEYPFRVNFKNELGVDTGGLTRDMFSSFYEKSYECLFDGSCLYSPIVHPEMYGDCLSVVGCILSHAYFVTGILPNRIAFPCLVHCLIGGDVVISNDILKSSFMDGISVYESGIIKKALIEVGDGASSFSTDIQQGLVSLLSRFNYRRLPNPSAFEETVINIAKYEFIAKPAAALALMNRGIPAQHVPFWKSIGVNALYSIYKAQSVTTAMALKMLEDAEGFNDSEERILSYLRQFIGNMGIDELRTFLRFTTGCAACSSLQIRIEFNAIGGLSRRPIAHTCGPSLTLSTTYTSYQEFVNEFQSCLSNKDLWIMDSV